MQLAAAIPLFKLCLQKSLESLDRNALEKKALEFQFDKLLLQPLEDLPPTVSESLNRVIIIDALDECERPEHLSRILALFSKLHHNVSTVRLRVLFTSRSAPEIVDAFEPLLKNKIVQNLYLHREFSIDTKADIRTFLETKFADIRSKRRVEQDPWPTIEDLDRLVQLATTPNPLFIYAATLCRFVYDEQHPKNPKKQLALWFKQCEDNRSQLNQIYAPILNQVFLGSEEAECGRQLQFLGALVLLATPLPARSLVSLLGMKIDDVNWWLPELHAVLDIPTEPRNPIRLLHKSFSDFLLNPDDPGLSNCRVNAAETHAMLVARCIQRMNSGLRQDICDIQKPGIFRDEIGKQAIDTCIPMDLRYACLYWVHHLQRSGRPMDISIYTFLYAHFLHWLEALSLLGRLPDGVIAVKELLKTTKVREPP